MKPPVSYLDQPVRSLQTMLRTIARLIPEHPGVIPDGIYGPQTRLSVAAFQRRHELPVTGIADQTTWEAVAAEFQLARIEARPALPLQIRFPSSDGKSPCYYLVQAMLCALADSYGSLPQPPLSGIPDSATAEALEGFQKLAGLPVTGLLDKQTWQHLVLQFTLLSEIPLGMS